MRTSAYKLERKINITPNIIGFITSSILHIIIIGFFIIMHMNMHKITVLKPPGDLINLGLSSFANPANPIPNPTPEKKTKKKKKKQVKKRREIPKVIEEINPQPIEQNIEENIEESIEEYASTDDGEDGYEWGTDDINQDGVVGGKGEPGGFGGGGGGGTEIGAIDKDSLLYIQIRRAIESHNTYPRVARMRNIQGEVLVEFVLYSTGVVGDIKIIKGSHKVLDDNTIKVIQKSAKDFPKVDRNLRIAIPIHYQLT